MSDFIKFRNAIQNNIDELAKNGNLFSLNIDKNLVWDTYINAFPAGTNELYRERTEHDCVCCKQFIRLMARVVGEKDGKRVSIMDGISTGTFYDVVAEKLTALANSAEITTVFVYNEKEIGKEYTYELLSDGSTKRWEHFHQVIPTKSFMKDGLSAFKGSSQTHKSVLKRSLEEISTEAVETVIELIEQKLLYRGDEHLKTVKLIKTLQTELTKASDKEFYLWKKAVELGGLSSLRNTVIGTLLTDISEGTDLNSAVKSFESKVAPHNYKRTTALVTPQMKENAKKKAQELGIEPSLLRRFATTSDFDSTNVLFSNVSEKDVSTSVIDEVQSTESTVDLKSLDNVQSMSIEDFINNVLPNANNVEVLLENRHSKNLVSLIAPVNSTAPNIFKWDNNFSWTYNGNITDSDMREAVKQKGGNVDGVFRFTHQWNYGQRNTSLMDLHVFMPGNEHQDDSTCHNNYGKGRRVGWNNRMDNYSGGVQDVDYTNPAPEGYVPVENITFPDIKRMADGKYICKVHNWNLRQPTKGGFKAEIEFDGQIFQYEYDFAMKHKEWITVAEVTLKNGKFSIVHKLQPTNTTSKDLWGVNTLQFHKVQMVMLSPNFWEGKQIGNKHYFFTLKDCKNPEDATGFYNEFMMDELKEHRKVFECLSSNLKAKQTDEQVSGVGFSSTQRNEVFIKVQGKINTVLKIQF